MPSQIIRKSTGFEECEEKLVLHKVKENLKFHRTYTAPPTEPVAAAPQPAPVTI